MREIRNNIAVGTSFFFLLALAVAATVIDARASSMPEQQMHDLRERARHGDTSAQRQLVEEFGRERSDAANEAARKHQEKEQDDKAIASISGLILGFLLIVLGTDSPLRTIYWRQQAQRTEGTIAGVTISYFRRIPLFRTVYRYQLPDGQEYIGLSDRWPTPNPFGRETGKAVPLFVFPERPGRVRPTNIPIFNFGYVACLLAGLSVVCAVFYNAEFFTSTWYVAVAVALLYVSRALYFLTHRDHKAPPARDKTSLQPGICEGQSYGPVEEFLNKRPKR